jgi:hypothetical protein
MREFVCKKLKALDGYWRVDGVGQVRTRGSHGVSCDVHFQRLFPQYVENPLESPYRNQAGTSTNHRLTVHVATLSHFKVGTIWRHGKLYREAPLLDFAVDVDIRHCQYVRLSEEVMLGSHTVSTVLNESYYKLFKNRAALKDCYYAIAPVVNNLRIKWIVIPASELLRFYYGPSSPMLTSVVRGKLGDYISLDSKESYLEGEEVFLRNRQSLRKLEAFMLGRLIASPFAMSEARHIHDYLATRSANLASHGGLSPTALTLHARFPFNDQTMLVVRGKRIKVIECGNDKDDQWGILAMEIAKCSHDFGFERLTQIRDHTIPAAKGSAKGRRGPPSMLQPISDEEDELETTDTAPNARLPRLAERTIASPFTDMPHIKFLYQRAGDGAMGTMPRPVEEIEVSALSMSDGTNAQSSRNILGTDTFHYQLDHTSRDLGIFLKMLTHMRVLEDATRWTIATKALSKSVIFEGEHLVSFPLRMGPRRRWHLIQDGDDTRARHIVLVEIVLPDGRRCYLLEMELRPADDGQCTLLLHSQTFHEIEESAFIILFRLTAIQRRWISLDSKWDEQQGAEAEAARKFLKTYAAYRFGHPHVEPDAGGKDAKRSINPEHWAKYLAEKITQKLFPH